MNYLGVDLILIVSMNSQARRSIVFSFVFKYFTGTIIFFFSVYAEASPEVFLDIIEDDLKTDKYFLKLMKPVSTNIFSRSNYTDLLWALEKLAWDKLTVARVKKFWLN